MYLLIVDDDPLSRKLLKEILKELREVKIIETDNSKSALDILNIEDVRAIVTDIMMPDMDGLEFITTVRSRSFDTPVIFISGFADKDIAIRAVKLGAFDFIEKPVQSDALLSTITKALIAGTSETKLKLQSLNLNATQMRVLEMVLKGLSNKEIAEGVNLSEPGVKYHIKNLLKRFESTDRTQLRFKVLSLLGANKDMATPKQA